MEKRYRGRDELCALTNSMPSAIRWRLEDYKAMLRTELAMLAAAEATSRNDAQRDAKRPTAH
jgi:hypothetical protein